MYVYVYKLFGYNIATVKLFFRFKVFWSDFIVLSPFLSFLLQLHGLPAQMAQAACMTEFGCWSCWSFDRTNLTLLHLKYLIAEPACVSGSCSDLLWRLHFLHAGCHSVLLTICNNQPGLPHQGKRSSGDHIIKLQLVDLHLISAGRMLCSGHALHLVEFSAGLRSLVKKKKKGFTLKCIQ